MKKIVDFITKHNRIFGALFMALVPLVCCIIRCGIDGKTIFDVYLPASTWNDELFYYKQVEAIQSYGFPQGFYGFNESHGMYLSFAAWSPVLLLPWIIWGFLFGWNLMSPIYCNLFLICLGLFLFTYIVRLDKKQMVILALLYAAFTPMTRYVFASMPEVTCIFLLIVFLAEAIDYIKRQSYKNIIWMFLLSSLLTLMRPYFILLLLLPAFYLFQKKKVLGIVASSGVLVVTVGIYYAIKHFWGAEYFTALYDMSWISTFLKEGIGAGIQYTLAKLIRVGNTFNIMLGMGFQDGLPAGALFAAFMLIMIMLIIICIIKGKKKEKETIVYGHFLFCMFGMWIALLLMYKMTEGSKHLSAFIVGGIFLLAATSQKKFWKETVVIFVFAFLFMIKANEPINYSIPYQTDEMMQELDNLEQSMEETMVYSDESPSFDNTIIWTFSDMVGEEEIQMNWQMLYALPKEYGINLCYGDYILNNFDLLQCRYLATVPGGKIDLLCQEKHLKTIGDSDMIVIYDLREITGE